MAKRVFISFAIEDVKFRDFLVGQAKNERTPFEFVNMAVKEPWDEKWKTQCRTRIKVALDLGQYQSIYRLTLAEI